MRNMNHIVIGTDDRGPLGMILGFVGIGVVLLCWVVAHYVSWKRPRSLQHMQRTHFVAAAARDVQSSRAPAALSDRRSVTPLLAKRQDARARRLETIGRRSFPRLSPAGGGLVEHPVALSLSELRALGMEEFVTMHHCIQGWTGIAQWKGVPMKKAHRSGEADAGGTHGGLLLVWRRTVRRRVLRDAAPGRTSRVFALAQGG